jgi:cardiolipin synthase
VLAVALAVLKRRGILGLPVHFLGKAATFNLLLAFPLILLGAGTADWQTVVRVIGWALAGWGTGLYLYAGWLYLRQTADLLNPRPHLGAV